MTNLVARDTQDRLELQGQLPVAGRPHSEAHQLNVARVWRLEPAGLVARLVQGRGLVGRGGR